MDNLFTCLLFVCSELIKWSYDFCNHGFEINSNNDNTCISNSGVCIIIAVCIVFIVMLAKHK